MSLVRSISLVLLVALSTGGCPTRPAPGYMGSAGAAGGVAGRTGTAGINGEAGAGGMGDTGGSSTTIGGAGGGGGSGGVGGVGGSSSKIGGAGGAAGSGGLAATGGAAGGSTSADTNWAEWPMPNSQEDVNNGAPNLESYRDNFDGTVTDAVTGLMWQQSVPGLAYTAAQAATYCTGLNLGGYSDWRVPTIVELVSIIDYDSSSPAINSIAFPSTPGADFISSTSYDGSATQMSSASFGSGATGPGTAGDVRCVR